MSTSYLSSPLLFKLRKTARYAGLYGLPRTLAKVRAQYHMSRTTGFDGDFWTNHACKTDDDPGRFVGIIGCGNFAYSCIGYYLHRHAPTFLKGTFDVDRSRSLSLCKAYGGSYAAAHPEKVIDDPSIRLVYISSNHASHADYAVACLEAGKSVHIEKPHVVTEEQLERLIAAKAAHPETSVFLGFNRPRSRHFRRVKEALDTQQGPTMINWFIAGHEIADDHWYFAPTEGGRVLGNLCHWTDLTLELVGQAAFPCDIVPVSPAGSKSDFCVGIHFADGSIAGITFSAKGHTFEGVREILNAHRGNALVNITDFGRSTVEIVEKRSVFRSWYRDHGHRDNVVNSFNAVAQGDRSAGVSMRHCAATARLFLGVKNALDRHIPCRVNAD